MALIRSSQVIHGVSAGVHSPEEGAVRGYASREKAQCEVRSSEEGAVWEARSAEEGAVRGTQMSRRFNVDLCSLDLEELRMFAGPSW